MKQRRRIYYSSAQRSEIWDRWQAGESMSAIGRRFDRESSSVFSVISPSGGIRPPVRHRPKQALSLFEREEISRGLSTQCSLRSIARRLGRSASTISRESQSQWWLGSLSGYPVRSGCLGSGAASQALQAGLPSAPEPDSIDQAAAAMVTGTIAGWLKRTYPGEPQNQVSHETIYRSLFIQARGCEKKLLEHLRAKRTIRRSKHASLKRDGLGQIKNAVSISERPASIEDRAVPSHWEGDLIGGSNSSRCSRRRSRCCTRC
jgi:hypothetical protein